MKKYIYSFLTLLALMLIGCGSDNDKSFSVYDDGNGTKSPRISKIIIVDYNDGNITNKREDKYIYNNNNILVEVVGKGSDTYSYKYEYKYRENKQLMEKVFNSSKVHSVIVYNYSDSLYMNNVELPVLTSESKKTLQDGILVPQPMITLYYHYEVNTEGKAVRLKNTTIQMYSQEHEGKSYMYDSNGKVIQVLSPDGSKKIYTYDDRQHIKSIEHYLNDSENGNIYIGEKENFIYKGDLLKVKEVYYRNNEDEKFELSSKETYTYENKPYYEAPSLVHIDEEIE